MYAYVVEEHSRRTAELVVNYVFSEIYESRRSIDTLCSVFWRTANPEKGKLENRGFSCQFFSVILLNSEKVWYETHQCFNWLSKIKGPSLNLKIRRDSHSGLGKSIQAKK